MASVEMMDPIAQSLSHPPLLHRPLPHRRPRRRSRRGIAIVYMTVAVIAVIGFVSFAVDFGRVQSIKNEMQSCADATALATMDAYVDNGYNQTVAATAGYAMAASNPVDKYSGVSPTVTFVGGTWNATTHTFSTVYAPGTPAVQVTISRTSAANNSVPLYFGKLIGISKCNVQATAISTLIDTQTGSVSIPSIADPYLAGMPSGTTTARGDTTTNATPYQQNVISVVPGTWITLTGAAGTTSIVPGTTGSFGPDGEATRPLHHGQNYDGSDWGIGPENGIGDAVMPACTLCGVFLTDAQPDTQAVPAMVDWTQPGGLDQPNYGNLQVQSPFPIGDGITTGGTVQKFLVPPGATRLYLGTWDGVAQSNNSGTYTATLNLKRCVRLVK